MADQENDKAESVKEGEQPPVTGTPHTEEKPPLAYSVDELAPDNASPASEIPVVGEDSTSDEEAKPVLYSYLCQVIGNYLAEETAKPDYDPSEPMKFLEALFMQHLLVVNAINADPVLTEKVLSLVNKEISRVTGELGDERKKAPKLEEPGNIIKPDTF